MEKITVEEVMEKLNDFNVNVSNAMNGDYIPIHMHRGIAWYVAERRPTEDFLLAVLENDLRGAVGHADATNKSQIPAYIHFFIGNIPQAAWGSPKSVHKWLCPDDREAHSHELSKQEVGGTKETAMTQEEADNHTHGDSK